MDWEAKCKELQNRIAELEQENRLLRCRLGILEVGKSAEVESQKTEGVNGQNPL